MDAPLRVLLDITPLGYGAEAGVGRAGIFRAAQGFAAEALRHPALDLRVAAMDSFFGEVQVSRYERRTGSPFGARRVRAWREPGVSLADAIALVDRAADAGETSTAGRGLMARMALLNRIAAPAPMPGTFDIYQSLRHALPRPDRVRTTARVLTVPDLIPLLFPAWCGDGFGDALRAILASVDPAHDWIACNSESTRQDICSYLAIDPDRVFVTPLAADAALFHPVADPARLAAVRARYGLGENPYLLSLCTIEPRKNLPHVIRCFSHLAGTLSRGDAPRLVLAGATGWKTGEVFDALANDPVARDRVVLTGHVPDEDLAPLYAGADAFVYASRYEGFGLPVLEAMACGVPVVTTTGGSLPEVAGSAAILVDPDDADDLVDALRVARKNPDLARAGLARASEFSWRRTVDTMVAAWRVMLARGETDTPRVAAGRLARTTA